MNLWAVNDESVASRSGGKKTRFADNVEGFSVSGWGADTPSLRRKQRGHVELLVEDHQTSDNEDDGPSKAYEIEQVDISCHKTDEIISAGIVEPVTPPTLPAGATVVHQDRRNSKREGRAKTPIDNNAVHHIIREFLLLHSHEDVVQLLDQERPMPQLNTKETKLLRRVLVDENAAPPIPPSLLEGFLVRFNEAKQNPSPSKRTKERSISAEKKSSSKKTSTRRKKPSLNVITDNLDKKADRARSGSTPQNQGEGGFNRLNHPGSTPRPQPQETIIWEPGSTPHTTTKDLRALGFEDVDDDGNNDTKTMGSSWSRSDLLDGQDALSEYALRKRGSSSAQKRVQLGNPGSTPTKEYIFFRETPPSFVTETIEEAVEVFEKLGSDPDFVQQAAVTERFLELQSSEVSKYSVGQQVNGLGAQGDINGVVAKVYGSRLCGTAGPGTIIIDTRPQEPPVA